MKILDHNELFSREDYIEQFKKKQEFEIPCSAEEVDKVSEWTKTEDYKDKNFARQALTVNPAKACQPLGAVLCSLGFENTLPFVHGSQGCVAYFRSHLSRHFKEPVAAVSSSMTEEAAVFGGVNNMIEGLENANGLYKPDMIAVSTTCMAEVIGDDLNAFIKRAKEQGVVPEDLPTPFAHTPSFVGSHITGYDNMLKGVLSHLAPGKKTGSNGKINIILGFDTYTGNFREIKRLLGMMGVGFTMLADISDVLDSPTTGEFRMYAGGTPLSEAKDSVNADATFSFGKYATAKTGEFVKGEWGQEYIGGFLPMGIRSTDELLASVSRITGKAIPKEIEGERGRAVDAMIDSHAYVHGKRFALVGDPDILLGLMSFVMEMGGKPVHIVCTNGDKVFQEEAKRLLAENPFGKDGKVYIGKDMWHLRSLMHTDPVDLLIGNSYAKSLWKDTGTPLVRIGFPLFDRHHLHRYPVIGYQGAINLVNWIVNTVLDEMDRKNLNSTSFDVIR